MRLFLFFSLPLFLFINFTQSISLVNKVPPVAVAASFEHGQIVNASGTQNTDAIATVGNPPATASASASDAASLSSSTDDKQETTDNTSACTVKSNPTIAPSSNHSPKLQRDDGNGNKIGMRINTTTVECNSSNSNNNGNNTKTAQATTLATSTESKYTESKNVDISVVSEFAGDASSIRYGKFQNSFIPVVV